MSAHIYNVTVAVQPDIESEWVQWMRDEHIPDVLATGLFHSFVFTAVYPEQEQDSPSFSIQYRANDLESIQLYMQVYAAELRKKHKDAWGDRALAFRTILEVLDEQ